MEHPKKKAIIEACLSEFAEQGFERANTNRICEMAGVSKGLIFHYFGTKQNLYLLTLEACMAELQQAFGSLQIQDRGFFEAMQYISRMKLAFFKEHPRHYRLMTQAFYNAPPALAQKIHALQIQAFEMGQGMVRTMVAGLPLKPGVDPEMAYDLILGVSGIVEGRYAAALTGAESFSEETYQEMENSYMAYLELLLYGIAEGGISEKENSDG